MLFEKPAKGRTLTVLTAEDSPLVRKTICEILIKNSFEVVEAVDGKEAIEIYEKDDNEIDAIVSDIRMPNVDGIEFAKHNSDNKKLPFIICTTVEDSKLALTLLDYGVQDYILKPVNEQSLTVVTKQAINRYLGTKYGRDGDDSLYGNVGSIKIPTKRISFYPAVEWIRRQVASLFSTKEMTDFIIHLQEFMLNAYEHGNLGITESEKTELIEAGHFESEVISREKNCTAKIGLELSVLQNEIALKIRDEGKGFDYKKYLNMSEDELADRIFMPNGRGIMMCSKYFDSIEYSNGGATVQLVKLLPK